MEAGREVEEAMGIDRALTTGQTGEEIEEETEEVSRIGEEVLREEIEDQVDTKEMKEDQVDTKEMKEDQVDTKEVREDLVAIKETKEAASLNLEGSCSEEQIETGEWS